MTIKYKVNDSIGAPWIIEDITELEEKCKDFGADCKNMSVIISMNADTGHKTPAKCMEHARNYIRANYKKEDLPEELLLLIFNDAHNK